MRLRGIRNAVVVVTALTLVQGAWAAAFVAPSAPASTPIPAAPSCPMLPADNILNTDISAMPVHARSSDWLAGMNSGSTNLHPDFGPSFGEIPIPYGMPYEVVDAARPKVSISFYYPAESDPGPYPLAASTPIEGGQDAGGDRHALIVDRSSCTLYEIYDTHYSPGGSWAGSGAIFDMGSNALRPDGWTSADAAGLPVLPLLLRRDEVAAGEVTHAIRFTATQTDRSYLWPARHQAGSASNPSLPPMGARFRLNADFDISGFMPETRVILTAMKRYGMILADNGANWYFGGTSEEGWDTDVLDELKGIPASQFEAVNSSSLMESANSGRARSLPPDGLPKRVNRTSGGAQSSGPSNRPALSADGRYVAFHSPAADLVPVDGNGASDIFVSDTQTGLLERVSVASDGSEANGGSRFAAITPDGRYVAFMSDASNLAAGDTNGLEDVYVHDRLTGSTELVSQASGGGQAGSGESRFPSISSNGRFVAFQSRAPDLVAGDTNGTWDVFVRDRVGGTNERISLTTNEEQGWRASARPSISGDGSRVAFHSWARFDNEANAVADVFVRNRTATTTTRASMAQGGGAAGADALFPRVSADGNVVAFHSTASNLVAADTNGARDVFVRNLSAGTTRRASTSTAGAEGGADSGYPSISSDGRFVAFHSVAANLTGGDGNAAQDVFVKDLVTGLTRRTSISQSGAEATGSSGSVAISAGGGRIVFHSTAANLIAGDTNGTQDIFLTA